MGKQLISRGARGIPMQRFIAAVREGRGDIAAACKALEISVDEYRQYVHVNAHRIALACRRMAEGASAGVMAALEDQAHNGSTGAAKILLEVAEVYTPGARVDLTSGGQALGVVLMPSKVPVGAPVQIAGQCEEEEA